MTDSAAAVKEAEASMANLVLDEVTGEKVSKSELKRRQKTREKEAKKKEKEATAPAKAVKKVSAEEEESNLTPNVSYPWRGSYGIDLSRLLFPVPVNG
jgi:lysyl-tRNA synthetase class 2